jgi:DMSO/TMAO reductase YedYZ molybdopterin-dependent catalytic subunit
MNISRTEAATALTGGVAGVAGSFGVAGRTPAFVVAPIATAVVDATPGVVVTTAIQRLGDWGHRLAFALAVVIAVGLFAGVALGAIRLGSRSEVPYTAVVVAGLAGWIVAVGATGVPKQSLGVAVPLAAVVAVAEREWAVGRERWRSQVSVSRRKVVAAFGALAGFVGVATYRGTSITGVEPGSVADVTDEATQAEADDLLDLANQRSLEIPGLGGLVTPIGEFYEVDINNVNPNPSDDRWELSVTGAVEREVSVAFEDLVEASDAVEHRFLTLRCVGERLNGEKMDTAVWTGVPVSAVLDRAGVTPRDAGGDGADDDSADGDDASDDSASGDEQTENCCVMVRAVDDYYEEFPLSALEDGFLAFGMNGRRLPREHGYPVRLLVPGHWGEINVKWVTEIEVLEEEVDGYWEKRGWHGTGPVNTVSKLHAVEHLDEQEDDSDGSASGGRVQVGGHAYAGTRGIQTVEVSTDGGESWDEATLSEPLPGSDVWREWTYEWEAEPGEREVVARAIDGEGAVQPEEFSQPYPSGPTGWVSRIIEV